MEKKEFYFVCDKYVELALHLNSGDPKEVQGRLIRQPLQSILFIKKPFRGRPHGRGEFKTSNSELAQTLREHSYFKQGIVYEVETNPDLEARTVPVMVTSGAQGTGARMPTAPSELENETIKAKVAISRKK